MITSTLNFMTSYRRRDEFVGFWGSGWREGGNRRGRREREQIISFLFFPSVVGYSFVTIYSQRSTSRTTRRSPQRRSTYQEVLVFLLCLCDDIVMRYHFPMISIIFKTNHQAIFQWKGCIWEDFLDVITVCPPPRSSTDHTYELLLAVTSDFSAHSTVGLIFRR